MGFEEFVAEALKSELELLEVEEKVLRFKELMEVKQEMAVVKRCCK